MIKFRQKTSYHIVHVCDLILKHRKTVHAVDYTLNDVTN